MSARVDFLGTGFDRLRFEDAVAWLSARTAESRYAYVVTPNVDHMIRLADAPAAVSAAYRDAALCLCDSRVLARLARMADVSLTVVPGSDLTAALFARVLRPADRLCVVGCTDRDIASLRALHPALDIVHHQPPMGLRDDPGAREDAARAAVAAGARFILLAVGSPQQELLAHEIAGIAGARGTALCIGASVDFLVGRQTRAPRAVRRIGMEWAWRLATNPRRLARRYLIDGPAIFPMVWRWRRARR